MTDGNSTQTMTKHVIYTIITNCWLLYEIFVIDSLEMMYREQTLPLIQQPGDFCRPYA